MPLPSVEQFIGTDVTEQGFKDAQKQLVEYVGNEVPKKVDIDVDFATKANKATTLAGYGIADAYTKAQVDSSIAAVSGGHKAYQTLAAAQAAKASLPANSIVEVTNDPTSSNNGTYQWNGTTLTKSAYDPLTQAKAYTDNEVGIVQAAVDAIPLNEQMNASKTELSNFFGDYQNGILIDATQESGVEVLSVENGVKTYASLEDYLPAKFLNPKIVVNKARNYEWSKHNIFTNTDAVDGATWAKTGATVSKNGDLFLLTTTATTGHVRKNSLTFTAARECTMSVVIKPDAATTHAYMLLTTSSFIIFDLVNKTVSNLGSAISAQVVDLGNGYLKLIATFNGAPSAQAYGIGLSDNASTVATKTGLSAIIEKPQLNLGGIAQEYLENKTATSPRCLPTFDYSKGERTVLIETSRQYFGLWSEDFTQTVWVKSGVNATKTATSPLNTLCSRLTSTTADATVLQTIADTVFTFSALIKRVTGTGSVFMTIDGGATWKDVTSEINSSKYSKVVIGGSGKIYGFKFATSGDEIDVCLANTSNNYNPLSPFPAYTSWPNLTIDAMWQFDIAGEVTTYQKFHYPDVVNISNKATPLNFEGADTARFTPYSAATATSVFLIKQDSTTSAITEDLALSNLWETVETTTLASYSKGRYELSVNGEYGIPVIRGYAPNLTTAKVGISGSGSYHLTKLLLIKEAINDYDIRNWRFSQAQYNPGLINVTAFVKDGQFEGTDWNREPIVHVLSDDNEKADFLLIHMNKNVIDFHPEAPARLMQRKIRYYKDRNEFVFLTDNQVFYEHDGWKDGVGHLQSAAIARIKSGANKGRLVAIFAKADSNNNTFLNRNIYRMFNDSEGDANAWTTPEKIIDSQAVFGKESVVNAPDGSIVVLPSNHPLHPDRIITIVYFTSWFASIYSDDGGQTWQAGTQVIETSVNEPTISYLPNGDLFASLRTTVVDTRINFKSTDGGATWVKLGNMVNFASAQVSGSVINLDESGANILEKPNGEPYLIISGVGGANLQRIGLSVGKIGQDLLTIESKSFAINKKRFVGYLSAKPIFNNEYAAVTFEAGSTPRDADYSCFLAIVKVK